MIVLSVFYEMKRDQGVLKFSDQFYNNDINVPRKSKILILIQRLCVDTTIGDAK